MLPTRGLAWHNHALLIAGYVVLDWASYLHPLHSLNITPWNPAPALVIVFLLQYGRIATLPTFVAIIIAEIWVRGLPIPLPMTMALAALLTAGYTAVAASLSHQVGNSGFLANRRNLALWALIVGAGTLVNSILFVAALRSSGYVPPADFVSAILHYWVGDGAGVLIAMPLFWTLMSRERRAHLGAVLLNRKALALLLVALGSMWLAFRTGETASPKYLYVLLLPVAWAASRNGLFGAVPAIALVQVGIITAVQWHDFAVLTVVEIQILAAVIALFGLFIAIVVEEKERVSKELRQTLRLAAAGEMTGALAHELNQPLTALSTYASACRQLLAQDDTGQRLRDAVDAMVRESARAAGVLKRLRDFFQTGTTSLGPVSLADLVAGAIDSVASRAANGRIVIELVPFTDCELLVDRLQLEVVLRNLLANAIEAVDSRSDGERRVRIAARRLSDNWMRIDVDDSGPGLTEVQLASVFDGFNSTKSSGMGLGLLISRAIVEAHGGSLTAEAGDHGAFRLLLPIEGENHET